MKSNTDDEIAGVVYGEREHDSAGAAASHQSSRVCGGELRTWESNRERLRNVTDLNRGRE